MSTKMKELYKGLKAFSHMFVVKEREMEIGFPTDVKHLAHIGLDGADGSPPSWMNEFKSGSNLSTASMGSRSFSRDQIWSSEELDQQSSIGRLTSNDVLNNFPPTNVPKAPKKQKRKKGKSSSSSSTASTPKKSTSSESLSTSSRSSRVSRKSHSREKEKSNL